MSIDLVRALKAPANIDGWLLKILIGGLLYLIPILCFVPMGYWTEYLINVMNGKDELPGGPSDNFSANFITGAKMFVGCVIIGIVLAVVMTVSIFVLAKLKIVGVLLTSALEFILTFLSIFLVMSFAIDKKILSMIDVARAMKIVKGNPETLNFILLMLLLIVIYLTVMGICIATVIASILVPFLSYAMGISMFNLVGQYMQYSPYVAELKAQNNQ